MEVYSEFTFQRKMGQNGGKVRRVFAVPALICAVFGFLHMAFWIPAAVFGLMYFWCTRNLNLEFDYTLTNEELDIDKVMSGASRKHMETLRLSQVIVLGPRNAVELGRFPKLTLVDYSAMDPENPPYIMIYASESGNRKLLLQLNEDMLRILKTQLGTRMIQE